MDLRKIIDKKDEESRSSIYKVRKSANDEASQIGAFADIKNAKALADSKKDDGYKVYDEKGNHQPGGPLDPSFC